MNPADFTRTYNAVQLATAPVLAVAGNSPTFLGHQLWEETRIALFKQSIDERDGRGPRRRLARVAFGTGWLRGGPVTLFGESVRLHQPLLPVLAGGDPLDGGNGACAPPLDELRLHQSTVWRWNRAIYDPASGGHLRIEMRALPAGPTVTDMLANAAFLIGLSLLAGRAGFALDLPAVLRARRAQLLPCRPARPGRCAELAVRGQRTGAHGPGRPACARAAATRPGRAGARWRGGSRGRPPTRRDLSQGVRGTDRRGMATPNAGRSWAAAPHASQPWRQCSSAICSALPPNSRSTPGPYPPVGIDHEARPIAEARPGDDELGRPARWSSPIPPGRGETARPHQCRRLWINDHARHIACSLTSPRPLTNDGYRVLSQEPSAAPHTGVVSDCPR